MTADERIEELLARAGQQVMVVKNEKQDGAYEHIIRINDRAIKLYHETHGSIKDCVIGVLQDEIANQDDKITDMANTIDRMEAALSNVIGEREQLKRELHEAATAVRGSSLCCYCKHEDKPCMEKPCDTCILDRNRPGFEWHGIQEVQQHGERVG